MHQVVRLRDNDGDGVYEEHTVVIGNLPTGHHRTRTILFDDNQRQALPVRRLQL